MEEQRQYRILSLTGHHGSGKTTISNKIVRDQKYHRIIVTEEDRKCITVYLELSPKKSWSTASSERSKRLIQKRYSSRDFLSTRSKHSCLKTNSRLSN